MGREGTWSELSRTHSERLNRRPAPKQSSLNGELLRRFTRNDAEEVWTHEGSRIQGWIVKPPAFDPAKRYPLFLVPHGGRVFYQEMLDRFAKQLL